MDIEQNIQKQTRTEGRKEAILPPPYRDHPSQIIPVIAHVADLISSAATGVTRRRRLALVTRQMARTGASQQDRP